MRYRLTKTEFEPRPPVAAGDHFDGGAMVRREKIRGPPGAWCAAGLGLPKLGLAGCKRPDPADIDARYVAAK